MKRKIKLGIVDDSKATLNNLSTLLEHSEKLVVAIKSNSGKHFLDGVKQMKPEDVPDIVLTDVDMPDMSGIDMVLIAKGRFPAMHFLMLTVYDDEELLFDAIKAGASGYLLKDEKISVIVDHMEKLLQNEHVPLSPLMAQKTLDLIRKSSKKNEEKTLKNAPELSPREIEVLQLLVDGMNYKKIAEILFVSSNTVKKHISNIYVKLHVSSKAEAIKMSHHYNLL